MSKKILLVFILVLFMCGMLTAQTSVLSGSLKDAGGAGQNGTLFLQLSQQAYLSSVGACGGPIGVIPSPVAIQVTNGTVPSTNLYGLDCLVPSNLYYKATFRDSRGNFAFSNKWTCIVAGAVNVGNCANTAVPENQTVFANLYATNIITSTINGQPPGAGYSLPPATNSVLGGIKGASGSLTCGAGQHVLGFNIDGSINCSNDSGGGGGAIPGNVYATDYVSIQAAISAAGTTKSVIIPASYSGVDPYTNPNNIQIIDFRSGKIPVIDVRKDYGAVGSGLVDDSGAIQQAIVQAEAMTPSPGVYFPPGTYLICNPLVVNKAGIKLYGTDRRNTVISPQGGCPTAEGIMLAIVGPSGGYEINAFTNTALLTGFGNSLVLTGQTDAYLDMRDCGVCGNLSGLSAFTAEATIKPTLINTGNGVYLMGSGGHLLAQPNSGGYVKAFDIVINANGSVNFDLTTTTASYQVVAPAASIVINNQYHIALSWDGSTLRGFINGVSVGTPVATAGTMKQDITEAVTLTQQPGTFPDNLEGNFYALHQFSGQVDGVRLSKSARYTSGFTPPTAKFITTDSNTLISCSFANQIGPLTQCLSGVAGVSPYLVLRRTGYCPGSDLTAEMQNLNFGRGGIYINAGAGIDLDRLYVTNSNPFGIEAQFGCNFFSNFTNMSLSGSSQTRYAINIGTGISHVKHIQVNGGVIGFVGTSNSTYEGIMIGGSSTQVYPSIFRSYGTAFPYIQITDLDDDFETSMPNLVTALLLDTPGQTIVKSSWLDASQGPSGAYAVLVNGNSVANNLTFADNLLYSSSSQTTAVHFTESSANVAPGTKKVWSFEGNSVNQPQLPITDYPNYIKRDTSMNIIGASYAMTLPNDTTTGTYDGSPVKITSAGKAIAVTAGDTQDTLGIISKYTDTGSSLMYNGKTGTAEINILGFAGCQFDNATTIGDYVGISLTYSTCHDKGSTRPTDGSQILGRVLAAGSLLDISGKAPVNMIEGGGSIAAGTYKAFVVLSNNAGATSNRSSEQSFTCTGGACKMTTNAPANYMGAQLANIYGQQLYVTASGGGTGTETLQTPTSCSTTYYGPLSGACGGVGGITLTSAISAGSAPPSNTSTLGPFANVLLPGGGGGSGGGGTLNTILNGSVNPSGGTGNNGDFYVNTSTNFFFGPKAGGVWPSGTSIVGPTGSTGPTGPTGPAGSMNINSYTFSGKPGSPASGDVIWITDGNGADCASGGSTFKQLCRYNGSIWELDTATTNNTHTGSEVDILNTWNNSGTTFAGLKMNIINTASATGSKLMDLQIAGTSKFNVDKSGTITADAGNTDVIINQSDGNTVFRGVRATAWADSHAAAFFQIGTTGDFIVFQTKAGNIAGRTMINSSKTSISAAGFGSVRTPDSDSVLEVTDNPNNLQFKVGTNGAAIGGGSNIAKIITGGATLTYTSISAQTCQEQTITVTGATTGKVCWASPFGNVSNVNLSWSCWVSNTNTASVRVCNPSSGAITPTAVTWNAWVIQ